MQWASCMSVKCESNDFWAATLVICKLWATTQPVCELGAVS